MKKTNYLDRGSGGWYSNSTLGRHGADERQVSGHRSARRVGLVACHVKGKEK